MNSQSNIRLLILSVPILVTLVAAWQHIRARTANQTPWKGGGFGMFASTDHKVTRTLKIWIDTSQGKSYPVAFSEKQTYIRTKFLAAPTKETLERVAKILKSKSWALKDERLAYPTNGAPMVMARAVAPVRIRLEYWKLHLTPTGDALGARLELNTEVEL